MPRISCLLGSILFAIPLLAPSPALAQNGDALFDANCSICHTIGGAGRDAPDLKDISSRRDRAWIIRFILDPEGVTKTDPYAQALAQKYDGAIMPPPEGLTRADIEAILTYIDQRSAGTHPLTGASAPLPGPATHAFTSEEIARGRALYAGAAPLANRGPACFACHDVDASDGVTGGNLGPQLAGVLDRLNGVRGLSIWLTSPPTPVMRSVYTHVPLAPDEVHAIVGFLDARAKEGAAPQRQQYAALPLLGGGLAVTILGFVAIGTTWRGRLRGVRAPLVALAAREPRRSASSPVTAQGFRAGGRR